MSFPSPEQYDEPREMTTARNWSQVVQHLDNALHGEIKWAKGTQ